MPVYRYNHGLPKKMRRGAVIERSVLFFVLLAIIGGAGYGAYLKRQDIRDAYARWQNGPLPEPVSWADASTADARPTAPPTASQPAQTTPKPTTDSFAPPVAPSSVPPSAQTSAPPTTTKGPTSPPPSTKPLPPSINLNVPFIPQAPFQVWDAVHEDACEESSILMLQAYYGGEKSVTATEAERRIQEVVAYEKETIGYFESTDAETSAGILRDFLKVSLAHVVPLKSADDIRRKLAAGHPVAVPTDGRALMNPNFRRGGPLYHMVVVKGYIGDKFITNDPGTRKGADYIYTQETLMSAAADWIGGDVDRNRKVMIVAD